MIYIIDNYDSFSYNLYQQVGAVAKDFGADVCVIRNDEMSASDLRSLKPDAVFLSPGPGRPADAGICEDVILELGGEVPILGVCLGHQAIVEALGGNVGYAKELMHGKSSMVSIDENSRILAGLGPKAQVARYHSLAAEAPTLPNFLVTTATDDAGEVMAVEHALLPIFGLQFHPESIMTPDGTQMVRNFLSIAFADNEE